MWKYQCLGGVPPKHSTSLELCRFWRSTHLSEPPAPPISMQNRLGSSFLAHLEPQNEVFRAKSIKQWVPSNVIFPFFSQNFWESGKFFHRLIYFSTFFLRNPIFPLFSGKSFSTFFGAANIELAWGNFFYFFWQEISDLFKFSFIVAPN